MLDFKTFFNCIYAYFGNQRSKSDYLIIFFDKFMEEPISKRIKWMRRMRNIIHSLEYQNL